MSRHVLDTPSCASASASPSFAEPASGRHARRRGRTPRTVAAVCGVVLAAAAAPVASAALPTGAVASTPPPAVTAKAADGRVGDAQQEILQLVNDQRAQHGCGALGASGPLNELAEDYSTEMGTEGFFSHTDPAGRSPWDRAKALGITNLGGENIAMGQPTPQAVMSAWMNSSDHRANILDCIYHSLGVGVYYGSGGGPWWTQDFGY
jgi:uncharacterized protein YkwD